MVSEKMGFYGRTAGRRMDGLTTDARVDPTFDVGNV